MTAPFGIDPGSRQGDLAPLPAAVIRKATPEDYRAYFDDGRALPTADMVVGEVNGRVVAIGGFAHFAGYIVAFINLKEEAKPYFLQLYSVARDYMAKAKARGYRRIYVERDINQKTADRFIRHFGFKPIDEAGTVYVWTN